MRIDLAQGCYTQRGPLQGIHGTISNESTERGKYKYNGESHYYKISMKVDPREFQ